MGFYNMMSGWGGGWTSWTMYLGMIVFWVGVVALVIWGSPMRTRTLIRCPSRSAASS